jgi:ubiquitin-protein ligase
MEYFSSIIDIIISDGNPDIKINIIGDRVIIEHIDIKLIHVIEKDYFIIQSTDYLSFHLLRLIAMKLGDVKDDWIQMQLKISHKLTTEYFFCLKNLFEINFYDYCTICGTKHDKVGLSYITTCNNKVCITKSFHYPISNKIIEFYKTDFTTLILLIKTLLSALTHPKVDKIFNPLPLIHSVHNINDLISIIPKNLLENKLDDLLALISESYDDFYLWKNLNNNLVYALIINAISNNYYSMYSFRDLVNHNLKKIIVKDDPIDTVDIEYFNINYSTEIENKIKLKLDDKLKYYYLYHGSPFYCWYSIIKNGLKVMSETEFMTTGAAYGNGIYLSDNLQISHSYAKQTPSFNYSMIGIFQITENPEKHNKTHGIYVVPDEKKLILRTLIKINKPIKTTTFYNVLNQYFIKQQSIDKNMSDHNFITLKNKRLCAELKLIDKTPEKYKVISCSDEQEIPWVIELFIKDKSYKLELQFYNYPLSPPLFRMKNFDEPIKGIIDKEYKINIPILELGIWNISNKIIEVLEIIKNFLESNYC